MKKIILVLSIFLFTNVLSAENPFLVYFETVSADTTNSTIQVDVKVKDFVNVYAAQMYMTWDSSVYYFDTLVNVHPELNNFYSNDKIYFATENNIAMLWVDTSLVTLDDETTIFSIVLNVIGQPCDSTTLKLVKSSDWRESLVTYGEGLDIFETEIRINEGFLMIPGGDCATTGTTSNISNSSDYIVYPNPANDIINIDFSTLVYDEYDIVLYNSIGQIITQDHINISSYRQSYKHILSNNFENSFIFIKITDPDNMVTTKKVII